MKRIIGIIIFAISFVLMKAETKVSFQGIPLEGDVNEFCAMLMQKGYRCTGQVQSKYHGDFIFRGSFQGFDDATFGVSYTPITLQVSSVNLFTPNIGDWNQVYNSYQYYVTKFKSNLGKPNTAVETCDQFDVKQRQEAVSSGRCTMYTEWDWENGDYMLVAIIGSGLTFQYGNSQNKEIGDKEQIRCEALNALAKSKTHMEFQGIKIDGSIETFDCALTAKGWTYDPIKQEDMGPTYRAYKGTLFGQKGTLAASWTPNSKVMDGVLFTTDLYDSRAKAEQDRDKCLDAIRKQFSASVLRTFENSFGYTQFDFPNGNIQCGIMTDYDAFGRPTGKYSIIITYGDQINEKKSIKEV